MSFDMETARFYRLHTVNRLVFYLAEREGERVNKELDGMVDGASVTAREDADMMFVHFSDMAGSSVRVCASHIEACYLSTPETREADTEIWRAVAEAEKAHKDWGNDE